MKTALVTGATGLIGGWLVDRLVRDGFDVRCVVRASSPRRWLDGLPVSFVEADLRRDGVPAEALEGVTHVFHLAGILRAVHAEEYFAVNAAPTRRLLEACVRHAPALERFVLVSSQAAAGPGTPERPRREDDPAEPVSHYGRSKLEAERAALEHADRLPVTIVRPPAVYGPRERDLFLFFRQASRGIELRLGTRERHLSLVHVHDLAEGIALAATHPRAVGRTYFLAHPDPVPWSSFGRAVADALGRRVRVLTLPAAAAWVAAAGSELVAHVSGRPAMLNVDKAREIAQGDWVCATERARDELGFSPTRTLREGVQATVDWYVEHGWLARRGAGPREEAA